MEMILHSTGFLRGSKRGTIYQCDEWQYVNPKKKNLTKHIDADHKEIKVNILDHNPRLQQIPKLNKLTSAINTNM